MTRRDFGREDRRDENGSGEEKSGDDVQVFRLGKDEMNLAEHPFAALWKNADKNAVLYSQWQTRHPETGKVLKASWRVEGSQEWGLPTASDERLYLTLMELTREAGWTQTVCFTRHDVCRRAGWPHNDRHYQMIEEGLARLAGVYITAQNAFYNPRAKAFAKLVGFHILEQFEVFPEARGRKKKDGQGSLSFFKWNDAVFQSFVDGNIRSIDLNFALSLKRPLTLRLFRFLGKKANDGRRGFEICLRDLCGEHLGMTVEGRYDADLRAGLKPVHAELIERGFLKIATFEPMKSRPGDKVCYEFVPRAQGSKPLDFAEPVEFEPASPVASAPVQSESTTTKSMQTGTPAVFQRMVEVGVSPAVADELLRTIDGDVLAKQLDCLPDRDAKNPAAVFVKAVREMWALPPAYVSRLEAQERAQNERNAAKAEEAARTQQRARKAALQASQDEEAARLDATYAKLDERNRQRIDDEATKRLGIVGQMRSSEGAKAAMRRQVLREMLDSPPVS